MNPAIASPLPPDTALSDLARQRLAAWLSLPPHDGAELLEGRIAYKSMPSIEQGDAALGIAEQLGRLRGPRREGRGGWWLSQEVDLYLAGNGVRPDLVGWRVDKHPTPPRKTDLGIEHLGVYTDAPDWVCEVLSASTRHRDESADVKWRTYWAAGVGHYWLVDLDRMQIDAYARGAKDYERVDRADASAVRPIAPFAEVLFDAARVFVVAESLRGAGTPSTP